METNNLPWILDGRTLSKTIREELSEQVASWMAGGGKQPHLAAILVGDEEASQTYASSKVNPDVDWYEIESVQISAETSEQEILIRSMH